MSTCDMTAMHNVNTWVKDNKQLFLPPVCNKMMHNDGQMKLFFVGGPNQRKDYHVECGEELFYQLKGDMLLKVIENEQHKDIHIKEGQIFLLPGCIQHSPQRFADTIGLVIERQRDPDTEQDGLRYFVEEDGVMTMDPLYEDWFYCENLGTQLGPIIKTYFGSEQFKTGKPIAGTLLETLPLTLDHDRKLMPPFSLSQWMEKNSNKLDNTGRLELFDCNSYQFQVYVYGKGVTTDQCASAETWIWQKVGESNIEVDGEMVKLNIDDSLLIPRGKRYTVSQEAGCRALVCYQDPTKSNTWTTRA